MVIVPFVNRKQQKGGIIMKNGKLAVLAIVAVCSLSSAGEAFARGGAGPGQGAGIRLQKRDGSCLTNSAAAKTQSKTGQQMRNGSGMNGAGASQGTGQGAMRRLGPGDGTGNAARPLDGTGYGSPAR